MITLRKATEQEQKNRADHPNDWMALEEHVDLINFVQTLVDLLSTEKEEVTILDVDEEEGLIFVYDPAEVI